MTGLWVAAANSLGGAFVARQLRRRPAQVFRQAPEVRSRQAPAIYQFISDLCGSREACSRFLTDMNSLALFLSGVTVGVGFSFAYARRARSVIEAMRLENRSLVARNAELRRDKGKVEAALTRAHAELQSRCEAPTIIEAIVKNKKTWLN